MNTPTQVCLTYLPKTPHSILYPKYQCEDVYAFEAKHNNRHGPIFGAHRTEYPTTKDGVGCYWMSVFHLAVVRDGVDATALHKTLIQIPEFRMVCAGDCPGLKKYSEQDNRDYGILCND